MQRRAGPIAKTFALLFFVFLGAGVVLGVPGRYTHHTIWAGGRVLFIPAGVILLGFAWVVWRERHQSVSVWMALVALALIGVGGHEAFAGPWTVLAIPACAGGALFSARACLRGDRDPWTTGLARSLQNRRRRRPVRRPIRLTRFYLAGLAVLCVTGVVLAASAI